MTKLILKREIYSDVLKVIIKKDYDKVEWIVQKHYEIINLYQLFDRLFTLGSS